jgi:hypothetical protein
VPCSRFCSPTPCGAGLLDHIERVAALVPDWARPVAWLHEVLEQGAVPEQELLTRGLSDEELRALRLLSHPDFCSDLAYLGHVELIARAGGAAGLLARAVKRADLEDRRRHPRARSNGWSPPYGTALQMLKGLSRRAAITTVDSGGRSLRRTG